MRRLWCRLVGHGRLRSRPLYEGPTIRYGGGLRDDHGRALAWPECVRCGQRFVVLIGDVHPGYWSECPVCRPDKDGVPLSEQRGATHVAG